MMLHITFAQWWRLGVAWHGSVFGPASGQLLSTFQLLANSNTLFTTSWPWVVKSFCTPSKLPHRPQTFPCQQENQPLFLWWSSVLLWRSEISVIITEIIPGTHTMLWLQDDADRCFTIPYHWQTDGGLYHQVEANCSYPVIDPRAFSQVHFFIFTLQQFHFHSLGIREICVCVWQCTKYANVQLEIWPHVFCTYP